MPSKEWDSQADWQTWSLTQLVATAEGYLEIDEGYSTGTGTSPIYEAANWERWSKVRIVGIIPTGCNAYLRFRTAATEGGCGEATWSDYVNGFDDDGVMVFDIRTYILNNAVAEGAFIQLELTLEGE